VVQLFAAREQVRGQHCWGIRGSAQRDTNGGGKGTESRRCSNLCDLAVGVPKARFVRRSDGAETCVSAVARYAGGVSTGHSDRESTPLTPSESPGRSAFVTTHWSVVLTAGRSDTTRAHDALAKLCQTYWYPLYAYVRRRGQSPEDAQDLTQEFFARLLAGKWVGDADRAKGRFRTFLLTALNRFLANEWDRQHAQKRGGFAPVVSMDQELAESRFASESGYTVQPDVLFERQWATTLLERTMARLQEEYVATGRAKLFEDLQSCLAKDESASPYAEIAARLNLTEAAVKMAMHRLRARYREILRAEIADTVTSPEEIEDEIRHLFSAFGP